MNIISGWFSHFPANISTQHNPGDVMYVRTNFGHMLRDDSLVWCSLAWPTDIRVTRRFLEGLEVVRKLPVCFCCATCAIKRILHICSTK